MNGSTEQSPRHSRLIISVAPVVVFVRHISKQLRDGKTFFAATAAEPSMLAKLIALAGIHSFRQISAQPTFQDDGAGSVTV